MTINAFAPNHTQICMAEPGFCLLSSFNLSGFLRLFVLAHFLPWQSTENLLPAASDQSRLYSSLLLYWCGHWTLYLILIGRQFLSASRGCPSFSLLLAGMCCMVTFRPMADRRDNGGPMRRLKKTHTMLTLCITAHSRQHSNVLHSRVARSSRLSHIVEVWQARPSRFV